MCFRNNQKFPADVLIQNCTLLSELWIASLPGALNQWRLASALSRPIHSRLLTALLISSVLLQPGVLKAEQVHVRHIEGTSRDRLLPSGTTTTGVSWLRPNSVSKCVSGGQINCGTSADGISDPAGSVSVAFAYILWQVYMTVAH